ncbi:MAG TPA: NF038122 family metalloprotease, partial [Terriglobales bacterium]|nr:NF038122 family metalloprotease [Terriglobales bacterium]
MKSENTLREFMSGLIRVPKTRRARVALLAILALTGTASALTINLTFDSDTVFMNAGLTAAEIVQMRAACNYAALQFTTNYTDPINVNIFVTAVPGTGTLGMSRAFIFSVADYATLRNAMVADSTTPDDATALGSGGSVPMADPIGGSHLYVVSKAERKALGLAADDLTNDGTYTFGGGFTYTYDPNNRAVPGAFDFIGVTMHEYSEIMGRIGSMGHNFFGQPDYMQFDLFHFTGAGVRGLNNGPGRSFSINNGTNFLKAFNDAAMNGGDLQDWAAGANDSFNAFINSGVQNDLTDVDLRVMDVIGYDRVATTTPTPTPTATHTPTATPTAT